MNASPRIVATLALTALFVAGCGGAEGVDLEPVEAQVTVPAADGQSDAPSGDDDQARAPVEVTTPPPPTRPIVSIPDSWPSDVEEVYGRYWLYWEAFAAAHAPPNADPSHRELRALSTQANWASLQRQLRDFAGDGLVLVAPERSKSEHLLRIPNASVIAKEEGAEVVLQDCWIDDLVQQTLDGQVVADRTEAKLMNVTMRVEDGQWRVDGVTRATAESDGYEQCEALVS